MPKLTKEYLKRTEVEMGEHANYYCSDRSGEYGSTALQDYFKSKGIHHEMTNAYTPQENGVSKQMNHTLVKMAHAMLNDAGLPNAYWGDAILYATHVLNCIPTRAITKSLTPHKAFTGNKPSIVHLRIFGCKAHVHIPDEKQCKLDAKSIEYTFLGFMENCKAYVCMQHLSGHVFESQDVVFNKGSANAPTHMKIDNSNLNIEEMKWSVAGTVPEAIGGNQDILDEDGKTMKGDQPPDGVSIDGEPSERVRNDGNVLVHTPDLSDRARSPPDVKSHHQITNVEVPVEQQVSRIQQQGKWPERTFDGCSSHLITPPSLYPVPIPTAAMRRSSCACRTPIHDENSHFFVNAYERATLEEEIQLNERGMDNLPSHIEALDNKEMDACADVTESCCDILTQSAQCAATATLLDNEPLTYNDAVERPDANLWLAAMAIKLNTFKEISLYQEVEAPPDHKIIDSKWVFKIKCGPNGEIDKYKGCLVVKGYTQVEGLDYTDTFAPVTKFTTIHSLLALAAQHDLEVHQIDVKVAFLNGELDEEIYLCPPPGFHDDPKVIWCLLHALYSLKQASKAWYDML